MTILFSYLLHLRDGLHVTHGKKMWKYWVIVMKCLQNPQLPHTDVPIFRKPDGERTGSDWTQDQNRRHQISEWNRSNSHNSQNQFDPNVLKHFIHFLLLLFFLLPYLLALFTFLQLIPSSSFLLSLLYRWWKRQNNTCSSYWCVP